MLEIDKIIKIILPFCKKHGYLPKREQMKLFLNKSLFKLIKYRKILMIDISKKINYPTFNNFHNRPKNFWKNIENVKTELLPICEKLGFIPSSRWLIKNNLSNLTIVFKYFSPKEISSKLKIPTSQEYKNKKTRWILGRFRKC